MDHQTTALLLLETAADHLDVSPLREESTIHHVRVLMQQLCVLMLMILLSLTFFLNDRVYRVAWYRDVEVTQLWCFQSGFACSAAADCQTCCCCCCRCCCCCCRPLENCAAGELFVVARCIIFLLKFSDVHRILLDFHP